METSKYSIQQISKTADIILIQEHWYFDCQLTKLNDVSQAMLGSGKATDTGDPILPVQMPRGFGGTAILWQKKIDHLITSITDGGNRIQCVELQGKQPILIISVYMPCRGLRDNIDEFEDCLSQLQEIVTKYSDTYSIIIGGDFNEDLSSSINSRRKKSLEQFLSDNRLATRSTGKTYTAPNGAEVSTIDYIFYNRNLDHNVMKVEVLDEEGTNVSDHYPLCCTMQGVVDSQVTVKPDMNIAPPTRVRWDKLDKDEYKQAVTSQVTQLRWDISTPCILDMQIDKVNSIVVKAARSQGPQQQRRQRKAKLATWTPEIQQAVKSKKEAFYKWKKANRPENPLNTLVINKKFTTSYLRKLCRIEAAKAKEESRQMILDARTRDARLFHKLINKQRGKLRYCVNEVTVNGSICKTDTEILQGWRQHFASLATPTDSADFDKKYRHQVRDEIAEIMDICNKHTGSEESVSITMQEVKEAIQTLNKGKAPDYHGVQAEHILYGGEELLQYLTLLVNCIFDQGKITDALKIGVLTPVFKNKGSNKDAKNYRGITILPIITKIVETLLRNRIQPLIEDVQSNLQRGFTKHSSPMNCSLILEEVTREYKDQRKPLYAAFLDVKSAFDVVSHDSLMRKLFHIGVEGKTWTLLHSMHHGAESVIKWKGAYSETFKVDQGVKQGGVLSTDLYKLYGNNLFERLTLPGIGAHIGEIPCLAPACADDLVLLSDQKDALQTLVNIAVDHSCLEHYLLQPVKSVLLEILLNQKTKDSGDTVITMKGQNMPVVTQTMHVGILRSANSQETAVDENIKKARRSIYGLMAAGLHGENGLDPETSVQLINTYVLPVLVYGLEVVLPNKTLIDKLERVYRKFLKQVLSLPDTVADPASYILSGAIPIEAVVHKRALSLFGSICRLDETAVEKQLARRQLAVKSIDSCSWYVSIRKILTKYSLPDGWNLLDDPPTKTRWKATVNRCVNGYWCNRIKERAALYPSLQYLNTDDYIPGRKHWLIQHTREVRDVTRLKTKLKLVTGSYTLQVNRACFNQNQVDPTCMICHNGDETTEHFILACAALEGVREPMIHRLNMLAKDLTQTQYDTDTLLQLILDSSKVIDKSSCDRCDYDSKLRALERQSISLCHSLHTERFKRLAVIPRRKR